MKRIFLLLGVVGGLACGASFPRVTWEMAEESGIPLETLEKGRQRYLAKCGGCHPLYLPAERTDEQWVEDVEKMRSLARLTPEDVSFLLAYLQTVNSR